MSARSVNSNLKRFDSKKNSQTSLGESREKDEELFDNPNLKSNEEAYQTILTFNLELPVHSLADLNQKIAFNSKKLLQVFDI